MLFAASYLGIPVSTTHTITGCVIGAGAARRASAVRWGIAGNVLIAWVITIPASATVAALFYWLISADLWHFGIAAAGHRRRWLWRRGRGAAGSDPEPGESAGHLTFE